MDRLFVEFGLPYNRAKLTLEIDVALKDVDEMLARLKAFEIDEVLKDADGMLASMLTLETDEVLKEADETLDPSFHNMEEVIIYNMEAVISQLIKTWERWSFITIS